MSPASISVSVCCMGQSWKCERSACEGKQPCFSVLGWNGGVHRDQDTISPWKTWKYQVTNYRKKRNMQHHHDQKRNNQKVQKSQMTATKEKNTKV